MNLLFTRFFGVLCAVLYLSVTCQAQSLPNVIHPKRILTPREGLPQSFVSGLVQSRDGFVWIGTRNGLARYDGRQFRLFQHRLHDTTTLSSNVIASLFLDRTDRIWIQYENEVIDILDPRTEQLQYVSRLPVFRKAPRVFIRQGLLVDRAGNPWGIERGNGVWHYDLRRQQVRHFDRKTIGSDTAKGFLETRDGCIWILTLRGLYCLMPGDPRPKHVVLPVLPIFGNSQTMSADAVGMFERVNGEIMFSGSHRLFFFHPIRKTFRSLPLPKFTDKAVRWYQAGRDGKEYFEIEGSVYQYADDQGIVHVGETSLTHFRESFAFLVDQSGLIWLGTNAAGVHQIDLTSPFFRSFPNREAFHADLLGQLYGMSVAKLADWPADDPQFPLTSYVFRTAYDARKRLWMGIRNRVGRLNPQTGRLDLLPPVPGIREPFDRIPGLRGLQFDPQGNIWVVGDNGYLASFDSVSRKWLPFIDPSFIRKKIHPLTIPADLVVDNDFIWITTEAHGLLCIDRKTKTLRQITREKFPLVLPTNQLIGIEKDPGNADLLWIGSYEGLVCLNRKTFRSRIFTPDDGLPDNTIYSILPDNAGYLWLSTNKGICQFHPRTHQVRVFRTVDGLPGDEFNRFHHFRLPDGTLAFGGTEGWVQFNPVRLHTDRFSPRVRLTDVRVNNVPIDRRQNPFVLNSGQDWQLPFDQNSLTFEFAGLQFNQPQKLQYRYQLEGYDDSWIYAGNSPTAHYTKLPPGRYVFLVNATNTTGQWSPHVCRLAIVVQPPFWRTWWAYLGYICLAGGLIWLYIRYRIKQEGLRQAVSLREKEAEQLRKIDEMKSHFFSNIAHEFRTPLTLILAPAELLRQELTDPRQAGWVSAIEWNAGQLLRLIGQLMDLARLESGMMMTEKVRGSISALTGSVVVSFEAKSAIRNVRLHIDDQLQDKEFWFDADKWERIVYNLVSNAVKFTPDGGKVTVSLSDGSPPDTSQGQAEGRPGVLLVVEDTGIGIAHEQLPLIFERYYRAPSRQPGTGIGLALVRELVEVQEGQISVRSEPGSGTRFSVWIPCRPAEGNLTEGNGPEGHPHVLLVEDNPDLMAFLSAALADRYRVSRATDGVPALALARLDPPDIIVSDIMMPGMDGLTLLRSLRADVQTSHIPVLLLSAKSDRASRLEGLLTGADDYLTKPFVVEELRIRVQNLLERQERVRVRFQEQSHLPEREPTPEEDPFLLRVYGLLEEQLDDSSVGVESLAGQLGMSRVHLHRKVKALTGMTTTDLIRSYRLRRAADFLRQGLNSSQTAYRVGFETPAYFARCFRERFGMTPLEFQKREKGMDLL